MTFIQDLLNRQGPWMTSDMEGYLRSLATMFSQVDELLGDDDDPQWSVLFDPDRCPAYALPYLAQFVGERLPAGLSEARAREWIKDNPNAKRGTMRSIYLAAQRHLIDGRVVAYWERSDETLVGDQPDHLVILTLDSQTPSPEQTLADILSVAPADIEIHYNALPGQTWADVAAIGTWADVDTAYDSWANLASDQNWPNVFSRPEPS